MDSTVDADADAGADAGTDAHAVASARADAATAAASSTAAPLHVACFCAAWCRTCGDYAPTFAAVGARFEAHGRFEWIDIEDQAARLGDIDVEDFPTLLVARHGVPVFFGPLLPHAETLTRLLQRALAGDLPPLDARTTPALGDLAALIGSAAPG